MTPINENLPAAAQNGQDLLGHDSDRHSARRLDLSLRRRPGSGPPPQSSHGGPKDTRLFGCAQDDERTGRGGKRRGHVI